MREKGSEQDSGTAPSTSPLSVDRRASGRREQAVLRGRADQGEGRSNDAVMPDISPTYLIDKATQLPVAAELWDEITELQLDDWSNKWQPAQTAAEHQHRLSGGAYALLTQSTHWDWRRKAEVTEKLLAIRRFSVMCRGVTQGMMIVDTSLEGRLQSQAGKPLVYIEFLETAPWNRPGSASSEAPLGLVGAILIRTAIELSLQEDFKGRIGLHSLPQSNAWYTSFCGMTDLGADAQKQNLNYFEMTPEQAGAFIAKGNTS